jgi:hypothetical protein
MVVVAAERMITANSSKCSNSNSGKVAIRTPSECRRSPKHKNCGHKIRLRTYAPAVGSYRKLQRSHEESTNPNYWSTDRYFELVSVSSIK